MTAITRRLEGGAYRGRQTVVKPLSEVVSGRVRPALLALLGAVGLVLLLACANIANLLLVRGATRTQEIAIRAALGATRIRLVRQLLTESILLSTAGGLGGLIVGIAGTQLVLKYAASQIPRAWEIGLDWRVLCFAMAISVATGIAFGMLPALTASRVRPHTALKQARGGGSGRWLRDGLVAAEVALSFVLLTSAGLLLREFLRLQDIPSGFVAGNVLTMRLTVKLADYTAPGAYGRYLQQLEDRLKKLPGVRSAGFISYLPLQDWGWNGYFRVTGRPPLPEGQRPNAELRYVSPGYFEALRIPLRGGRFFTAGDTNESPRVVVVNEALVRRYFPNEDPIGRATDRGVIVGVAGDVKASKLDSPASPEIYYSFAQNPAATSEAGVSLVLGTRGRPEALANEVRRAVHDVNPQQVVYDVKTMEEVIAATLADMHLYLRLLGLFAGLALVLTVAGIYGVVSYIVTARTPEFGIRLALGAQGAQMLRLVLGRGAWLVAAGLVFGAAGAVAAERVLRSFAGGAIAADLQTIAAVSLVLGLTGLAACLVPARRAMAVDPNTALRHE